MPKLTVLLAVSFIYVKWGRMGRRADIWWRQLVNPSSSMDSSTNNGKITLNKCLIAVTLLLSTAPVSAYTIYFGEDLNQSSTVPLSGFPNATNAENLFKSSFNRVGTEVFNSASGIDGNGTYDFLTFQGSGTPPLSAVLDGNVSYVTRAAGAASVDGLYGISGNDPETYMQVADGQITITWGISPTIAGFGFYGIDVGDFGDEVLFQLSKNTGGLVDFSIPYTRNRIPDGSTSGSVFFFGVIADAGEEFLGVRFNISNLRPGMDIAAFDNMTLGADLRQVCGQPGAPDCPAPEPGTLPLLGLGVLSLAMALRAKKKY